MSLFDFPRINFHGIAQLSPGTANNDDYAGAYQLPASYGPYAGQTLALMESKLVEPRTYGMDDADFIAWVQKAHTFDRTGSPGQTAQIIPAEWNYYGAMDWNLKEATITGVQIGPDRVYAAPADGVELSQLCAAKLEFSGNLTDVNSEGSPPATQFFLQSFSLTLADRTLIDGALSKGVGQWLNFYRNINLTADGGAGAYVYHVMPRAGNEIDLAGFEGSAGIIVRYYLYRPFLGPPGQTNADIEKIYQDQGTNPAELEIVGTIAPLNASETILSVPVGRLLTQAQPNLKTPDGTQNNGNGTVALAPAVIARCGDRLSADFSGTFPDFYHADGSNPKWDFGSVALIIANETSSAQIGSVPYQDTAAGNRKGWLFDFDLSANPEAKKLLDDDSARLSLVHESQGPVLSETDYYLVSNQLAVYGEQHGPGTRFRNQGTEEPATISVFRRGRELTASECPPISVWEYASVPLQDPGDAVLIAEDFAPGEALDLATDQPGDFLITFTVAGSNDPKGPPPVGYSTFMNPPYITNWPQVSIRLLPNNEDFSRYYVDPTSPEPVGNEELTFEVVFRHALRTYYLLYPAMNLIFPLDDEAQVAKNAKQILAATDYAVWMSLSYMPRTRDLSDSRRTLLRAWCRKVIQKQSG